MPHNEEAEKPTEELDGEQFMQRLAAFHEERG